MGAAFSASAITLTSIEQYLRVGGAFVGFIIGVVTLYQLVKPKHKSGNECKDKCQKEAEKETKDTKEKAERKE